MPQWRTLRIIHFALLAGLALSGAVYFALRTGQLATDAPELGLVAQIGAPASVIIAIMATFVLPQMMLQRREAFAGDGASAADLQALLAQYQTQKIIQWALIEGAGMFAAVMFFLTGAQSALAAAGVALLALAWRRPTVAEFAAMFALSETEVQRAVSS